jgi:HAMP domain-containing protein
MRLSEKLAALLATAALLPLITASIFVLREVSSSSRSRAGEHLRASARAAASMYERRLGEMRSAAQRLADDIANKAYASRDNADRDAAAALARLQDMLPGAHKDLALDFLIITDPAGRVIARNNGRPAPGETLLGPNGGNLVAERVIFEGARLRNSPTCSAALERDGPFTWFALDSLARVERQDGSAVNEALVIEAGAPILVANQFLGMVLIGQMLNTYYRPPSNATLLQTPLVAEARQVLFQGGDADSGALIALGDTIVASSLPLVASGRGAEAEPALKGARRDPAREDEVIAQGGDAYAVSWQPIRSLDGAALGAIGVAVPASELEGAAATARVIMIVLGALWVALAAAAGFFIGRRLGTRVTALTEASHRMSVGELSTPVRDTAAPEAGRIQTLLARDEISRLADQMDAMRESFRQAIERMRKR